MAPLTVESGVYLPLSSSSPIFFGGMIRWLVDKMSARRGAALSAEEEESGPGILFSSGLIAGGSIAGIALAIVSMKGNWGSALDLGSKLPAISGTDVTSVTVFVVTRARRRGRIGGIL